jgi:uncharacterized protein YqhQ
MADQPAKHARDHLYGGQAVLEGVMMRGRDHWALAVRLPSEEIHVESHDIQTAAARHPVLGRPGIRGVVVLWQSLSIGIRALSISARVSSPEDVELSSATMGISLAVAGVVFIGVFVVFPAVLFDWLRHIIGSGLLANVLEGVFRVALFLLYLAAIGRTKDIRRVFEYHGAEHKTIAAYEHDEPLTPGAVDRYSTLHVRCGTNFLLIVMILTIIVFAFFGTPPIAWRIASRIIAIPLIAAGAYELLRLGARFPNSAVMRAVMTPGLWLQRITTKPPDAGQIEVAITSFREVLRAERDGAWAAGASQPSSPQRPPATVEVDGGPGGSPSGETRPPGDRRR